MAARLREHHGSKHGPKWHDLKQVEMRVFPLPGRDETTCEGVEAELVYLLRKRRKTWPTHQNEIHFRHRLGRPLPQCQKEARRIFAVLCHHGRGQLRPLRLTP